MENQQLDESEEASSSNGAAVPFSDILVDDPKSTAEKLTIKERCVHIPYILNGELYEIQTQDGENVTVKCCHCPPDRVYRGSVRSTGNFHMHIKRRHPDLLGKLHDMKVTALLERRDRLMKNRKPTALTILQRRTSAPLVKGVGGASVKRESQSDHTEDFAHTHKLKIRTAFQRHQMQQQEAMMRKSDDTTFDGEIMMIVETLPKPINYSLKESNSAANGKNSNNNNDYVQCQGAPEHSQETVRRERSKNAPELLQAQLAEQEQQRQSETYAVQSSRNQWSQEMRFTDINPAHSSSVNESNGTTAVSPCLSSISSYSSHKSVEPCDHYRQTPIVIKNENPMTDQALDLSLPLIGNSSNSSSSSGRGVSRERSRCTRDRVRPEDVQTDKNIASITMIKLDAMLQQVDRSVRGLQRELGTRNQIETNRMFLDIAKFKYLHPGFNFNY